MLISVLQSLDFCPTETLIPICILYISVSSSGACGEIINKCMNRKWMHKKLMWGRNVFLHKCVMARIYTWMWSLLCNIPAPWRHWNNHQCSLLFDVRLSLLHSLCTRLPADALKGAWANVQPINWRRQNMSSWDLHLICRLHYKTGPPFSQTAYTKTARYGFTGLQLHT